jgi:microcystin degradation protein MlrC
VIGVEPGPHSHLTLNRVRQAGIIVLYKEFPHTGVVERAEVLLTLMPRNIRGEIHPITSMYDCRQIGSYPTTLPLMGAFVDKTAAMEGHDGALSVSIAHCFPYAGVPELSDRVLVITDNDKDEAGRLATSIGEEFVSMRGKIGPASGQPIDAVGVAPRLLAEFRPNPGSSGRLRRDRDRWRAGCADLQTHAGVRPGTVS